MRKKDVPQDTSNLSSKNMKELCYAIDEDGKYTTELSTGWNPKTIALSNAIEEIEERINAAREKVKNGIASPIEYYMEVHKMDIGVLASYVGLWKWQVKRHFKPKVFQKLSDKKLEKYAAIFDISLEELKNPNI